MHFEVATQVLHRRIVFEFQHYASSHGCHCNPVVREQAGSCVQQQLSRADCFLLGCRQGVLEVLP